MSVESLVPNSGAVAVDVRPRAGLRQRLAERRRLAGLDRTLTGLADLHSARTVLVEAAALVAVGWIQQSWFAFGDEQGRQQVAADQLERPIGRRLTGVCLVGAIVQAGGGVPAAHSEPVHRALDLTWQALHGYTELSEHRPAPVQRVARVRELTGWNDQPRRRPDEVTALLAAATRLAADRIGRAGTPVTARLTGDVQLLVR